MTMDPRSERLASAPPTELAGSPPIILLDELSPPTEADPGTVVLTCANCGATRDERKCKLICRCGYFLSCSDYY
jgi:hypothetical protein